MKFSFLNWEKPPVVLGLDLPNVEAGLEQIRLGIEQGAEAFCTQMEELPPEYQNVESYQQLFAAAGDRPVYVTNYRPKDDRQLYVSVPAEWHKRCTAAAVPGICLSGALSVVKCNRKWRCLLKMGRGHEENI